jgi:uncharacterized protein VirK/YbjX
LTGIHVACDKLHRLMVQGKGMQSLRKAGEEPFRATGRPSGKRPPRSALRRRLDEWVRIGKRALLRRIYRRQIATLEAAFRNEPLARIHAAYPEICLKPTRSYLMNGLKHRYRTTAVLDHYRIAARLLTVEALVQSHTDGVRLLALPTKAGEVTVDLCGQGGLYREAEWRLALHADGRRVMEMGLAMVDRRILQRGGEGNALWIGVLKTALAGEHGLDDSRALTKAMEGLRPKTLLLLVAQVLARSLGLTAVLAASNKGHVFAGDYSLRHRVKADYDSFWIESGGERVAPAIFALPLSKAQRDPGEYKPNKRAQIRRRQLLESDIENRIRENIAPLLCA